MCNELNGGVVPHTHPIPLSPDRSAECGPVLPERGGMAGTLPAQHPASVASPEPPIPKGSEDIPPLPSKMQHKSIPLNGRETCIAECCRIEWQKIDWQLLRHRAFS